MNFEGILAHFQHLEVKIGLWRARGADSNKTYAFLRCFEGPGAAKVCFLVDFHKMVVSGCLLGDSTKKGMEVTRFHTFYQNTRL